MHINNTFRLVLALILLFAVRVLFFFVVTYPETGEQIRQPDGYWTIAENLLNGKGYIYDAYVADHDVVTAKRGPTTVLLFWGLFRLFGVSSWPILVTQWLLDVGTGWLIYHISRLIFPNSTHVGWLAVCLYAVYWLELNYTVEARSEVLFTFLLAAFTFSLLRALQTGKITWFMFSGFLLGLVHHTRPVMSLFPAVMFLLLIWLQRKNKRVIIQGFTSFCVLFALVLLPWGVRNYLLFQRFIPGTTLLGYVLYYDFRDHLLQRQLLQDESGKWLVPENLILETTSETDYRLGKSEAELDQLWVSTSVELIKRYPGEFGLWCLNNVVRFWFNLGRSKWDHPGASKLSFSGLINAGVLVMAAIAYRLSTESRRKLALILPILVVYYTAVHAVTSGELRYSVPIAPYLLMLAAVTLLELHNRWTNQRWPNNRITTSQ